MAQQIPNPSETHIDNRILPSSIPSPTHPALPEPAAAQAPSSSSPSPLPSMFLPHSHPYYQQLHNLHSMPVPDQADVMQIKIERQWQRQQEGQLPCDLAFYKKFEEELDKNASIYCMSRNTQESSNSLIKMLEPAEVITEKIEKMEIKRKWNREFNDKTLELKPPQAYLQYLKDRKLDTEMVEEKVLKQKKPCFTVVNNQDNKKKKSKKEEKEEKDPKQTRLDAFLRMPKKICKVAERGKVVKKAAAPQEPKKEKVPEKEESKEEEPKKEEQSSSQMEDQSEFFSFMLPQLATAQPVQVQPALAQPAHPAHPAQPVQTAPVQPSKTEKLATLKSNKSIKSGKSGKSAKSTKSVKSVHSVQSVQSVHSAQEPKKTQQTQKVQEVQAIMKIQKVPSVHESAHESDIEQGEIKQ